MLIYTKAICTISIKFKKTHNKRDRKVKQLKRNAAEYYYYYYYRNAVAVLLCECDD